MFARTITVGEENNGSGTKDDNNSGKAGECGGINFFRVFGWGIVLLTHKASISEIGRRLNFDYVYYEQKYR